LFRTSRNSTPLTPSQQRCWQAVLLLTERLGGPPTLRELQHALGHRSVSSTAYMVGRLRAKGFLAKGDGAGPIRFPEGWVQVAAPQTMAPRQVAAPQTMAPREVAG